MERQHQDWRPVVFDAKRGSATPRPTPPKGPSAAQRLEDETEELRHGGVPTDLRRALAQARAAKGLTREQLAQALSVPASLVRDYETGAVAVPQNALVARMEAALGAKLPRVGKAGRRR